MNTIKARRLRTGIFISAAFITFTLLVSWLWPDLTNTWNNRVIDGLFRFRSHSAVFQPHYDDTVVHADISQSTLQSLGRRHLSRRHHARAVANLGAMGAASQLYDVIFASEIDEEEDRQLVEAARMAGNAYFGLMLRFAPALQQQASLSFDTAANAYLQATLWRSSLKGRPGGLPQATDAIITFPRLAEVSRGLGSLNLQYDPDGVYRRYPLLYAYKDAFYPSIALRVVCDYLGVMPEAVVIEPGRCLTLADARFPGADKPRDIRIPIDASGNMVIDFIGPWDRMRHYNFADIFQASDRSALMNLWKKELAGKIVVVSEVLSGSSDAGPVPTDTHYPLSGVHANALHTILTESFFRSPTNLVDLAGNLVLAAVLTAAFVYLPAWAFGATAVFAAAAYSGVAVAAFLYFRWMLDFVQPLGILFLMLTTMLVHRAIEKTRVSIEARHARDLVEKELEIGRRIQADFFPSHLPQVSGWQLAATMRPAKQVAGDFYDIFTVKEARYLTVVIGDVCGKGVGAAIFMALFRSLVRALCQQQVAETASSDVTGQEWMQHLLQRTIHQANNYIAVTHEKASMFATLFFAICDTHTGEMVYMNCGQEPPLILDADGSLNHLDPTGPVVGIFPDTAFNCRSVQIKTGALLFACTDGVSETPDPQGQLFPTRELHTIIRASHPSLRKKLDAIEAAVDRHSQEEIQFDDITMVAVRREEPTGVGGEDQPQG